MPSPLLQSSAEPDRRWIRPTVLLCSYGFFSYVKPIEPFLTPYLMSPQGKNFTEDEVVNQIYPVWSYSYMAFLVPIFLLTDILRYKPIIIVQGFGYISCWLLLIFAETVPLMQLMQVCYGLATAAEIGYYSYIYSVVDTEKYQKVTGYARASTLTGLFLGSLLSQLLVSFAGVNYQVLNYISLMDVSIAFVIALFLPLPKRTMFFFAKNTTRHLKNYQMTSFTRGSKINPSNLQDVEGQETEEVQIEEESLTDTLSLSLTRVRSVMHQLWFDLKQCYSTPSLLRWSIWWMFSTCGWMLVVNYIQNMWETIRPSNEEGNEIYNGATESLATLLGAAAAMFAGVNKINWGRWGEVTLGLAAFFQCLLLAFIATTSIIWVSYGCYILFIALYYFVITIAQYQIALGLSTEKFALVFGMNTFLSISLNSLLTFIIIDDSVLGLGVDIQFIIYSVYFGIVGVLYFLYAAIGKPWKRDQHEFSQE